jgi:uncharacterized SAM-binding protein YcdF (DUF218 family)
MWALFVMTLAGFSLRHAGDDFLAVEDSLAPAEIAVVLGGDPEFRGAEAARLYEQGLAGQIWLTASLEDTYSREVFERMGVPRSVVRVFDWHQANTASELRAIACEIQTSGGDSIMFVTSTYHSRRVKELWQKLTGDHPHAIVRYARKDVADTKHWWRTSYGARSVWHEWFGLLRAWITPARWL